MGTVLAMSVEPCRSLHGPGCPAVALVSQWQLSVSSLQQLCLFAASAQTRKVSGAETWLSSLTRERNHWELLLVGSPVSVKFFWKSWLPLNFALGE